MTDDETYAFDPAEFREDEGAGAATGAAPGATATDETPRRDRRGEREFGWRGWVLVGMLFVGFVLVPVALYFLPRAQWFAASIGLGYRDAFLVLPLVPALLLGALAVWATTRP